MGLRALPRLMVVAALSGSLVACSVGAVPAKERARKDAAVVPPGGVLVRGAGATFPAPLYERWFQRYSADHPSTVITYDAVGSGEGIRRFTGTNVDADERVDFGASDAALRDDELAKVSGGAFIVPLTAGSVALAYELSDLPGDLRLSRDAYTGIFLGTIHTWNDPRIARTNPGVKLPNLTISTVVRQDASGTTFAFTRHLDAVSPEWHAQFGPATHVNWPGDSMRASGNEGVAARIKQAEGSIGYVSYEFARKIGLKVARLQNRAGQFVAPVEAASSAALAEAPVLEHLRLSISDPTTPDAYPIVTFTWVMLYRSYSDPRTADAVRALFRWCLADGQRDAADLGYVPLPPAVVQRSLAALDFARPAVTTR